MVEKTVNLTNGDCNLLVQWYLFSDNVIWKFIIWDHRLYLTPNNIEFKNVINETKYFFLN